MERRGLPSLKNLDDFLDWLVVGRNAASGVRVTPDTALACTAVLNAVTILAGTLASLPLLVYRRLEPRGKERATNHPLYPLLHTLPNPEMAAFNMREAMMGHLLLRGNAYCDVVRNGRGEVKEIWPLRPDKMVDIRRNPRTKKLEYLYRVGKEDRILSYDQVLHIPGLGYDGIVGYSPITLARDAIGLAMAAEEYLARFYGNDSSPGGALVHPGALKPEAKANLKKSWEEAHRGLTNKHRVAVLEEGIEWKQIGISPQDAEMLATRKFQVTEVARIFNLPPHKLKDLEKATFSNIEEQSLEFVIDSVRPWAVRWEQNMSRCLLTERERKQYFVEHLVDGLLRGDIESRYNAYAVGREKGWLSANDIRELENMNPLPGKQGDIYLVPLNMVNAELVADGSIDKPTPGDPGSQDDGNPPARGQRREPVDATGTSGWESRSATARRRVAASYRVVFEDAALRVIKREKADIMREAEKELSSERAQRSVERLLDWLEVFYEGHQAFVTQTMSPSFEALAEAIQAEAAEEVGLEAGLDDAMEAFLGEYTQTYVARHIDSSLGQLRAVIEDARANDEDVLAALQQRFDEWLERRPGKIAGWETIRASSAVAQETYRSAGRTRKTWRNFNPSCPYCQALDGRVVGIDEWFLPAGNEFEPDGAEKPLVNYHNVGHAPAHEGCDCTIGAA